MNHLTQSCRLRTLLASTTILALSACSSTTPLVNFDVTGKLNDCERRAVKLEQTAQKTVSYAQYNAAANTLNNCLAEVSPHSTTTDVEQRMQLHAMMILNRLKGGDAGGAAQELATFKRDFAGQDLYFSDMTSFIDTATVLLSHSAVEKHQLSMMNINSTLREDTERKIYWLSH